MKTFIFSKRFLIPLFIVWVLHLLYIQWEMWQLWKDDFTGKGLPFSLKVEWMLTQIAGGLMSLTFLIAFLIAITYYSHYNRKRHLTDYNPFSSRHLLSVFIFALIGFFYSSFVEPKSNFKSNVLLANIVWSKPHEEFKKLPSTDFSKDERSMTLSELIHIKDSLASNRNTAQDENFGISTFRLINPRKIDYEIAKKIIHPINIVLFYVLGILLATSFLKTRVIFPLLIAYFILLVTWYYGLQIFDRLFKLKKVEAFIGAAGITITFSLIAVCWYFILKKYEVYKRLKQGEQERFFFESDKNAE